MEVSDNNAGVAVDRRLAPAGMTRLLGGDGTGRRAVLGLAGALFAAVTTLLLLVPAPPASLSTLYVLPDALVAAEIGTRSGMLCAAASIVTVIALPPSGVGSDGVSPVFARPPALGFLAFVVGGRADRAAPRRRAVAQ